MVVSTPTVTGPATARAPEIAASNALFPRSLSAAMLSPTTTASSTTMPISRKNANRVPMFSVRSETSKNNNAPMKEIGIPTAIHVATRRSNTRTRQTKTRIMPMTAFSSIPENLSRTSSTVLFQTSTSTPAGGW